MSKKDDERFIITVKSNNKDLLSFTKILSDRKKIFEQS